MKTRFALVLASVVTLLFGGAVLWAQRPAAAADRDVTAGIVIAGPEVGFRIDHYNGTTPVGELVVKRDGTWIRVEFGAKIRPVK